jgi:hypothetical protein
MKQNAIPPFTYVARRPDGKLFPVNEDDPRRIGYTVPGVTPEMAAWRPPVLRFIGGGNDLDDAPGGEGGSFQRPLR